MIAAGRLKGNPVLLESDRIIDMVGAKVFNSTGGRF